MTDSLLYPKNYSGHSIVACFAIAQLIGTRWTLRFKGLDHNVMPRDSINKAEIAKRADPSFINYVKRRNAAHYNGLENLSFFVAAVILANIAKIPTADINYFCGFYTGTRVLYTVLYTAISHEHLAAIRTVVWWTNMLSALRMLLRAGAQLS